MVGTEAISIVELGVDDARSGLRLSTEVRWNQTEDDWRFFLLSGRVLGVRDKHQLVATAALLPYAPGNAWISMVLVTAEWRRRGIATRLVNQCLDLATKLSLTPWLDATPDGVHVYGPLGFKPTSQLQRLRLNKPPTANASRSLSSGSVDQLIARDRDTMGLDRSLLLTEFAGRPQTRIVSDGYAMALVRDGRTARHIGPLFARSPEQAVALVDAIVQSEAGPLLIDAINPSAVFLAGLTGSGWTIERPLQRMRFGSAIPLSADLPYAVAGPEFG